MKKIYLILLFALLTYSIPMAQTCQGFFEGFESGSYTPTWSAGSGPFTWSVNTTNPAAGSYSISQTGGNSSHLTGLNASFTPSQPSYISYWGKSSSTTLHDTYFAVGSSPTSTSNQILYVYFWGSGSIRFLGGTAYLFPYNPDQWYHIEFKNINWSAKTYDIWIDDTLRQSGHAFYNTAMTSVNYVNLYNFSPGSVGNYDNIIIGNPPVEINLNPHDLTCAGSSNGSVASSVSGGTPSYSYLWSTGDTIDSISGLPAGVYNLLVTDSQGCMDSDTVVITAPPALTTSLSAWDPLCNGGSDGGVAAMASGGTPGYSYLWSTSDTTDSVAGLGAGSYSLTLTDNNGCSATDSVWVTEPSAISLQLQATPISCFGANDGQIQAGVNGGTPGYTYLWSNGDPTSGISGLMPGNYSVTVWDSNGCMAGDSTSLSEPTALASSGSVTDESGPGAGDGAIDLTVNGGTPPYTYAWSNGGSTEDLSNLSGGTYSVTITDAHGCAILDTFQVGTATGLESLNENSVSLFPNPARDQFSLQLSGQSDLEAEVRIFDLSGKSTGPAVAWPMNRQPEITLNIGHLSPGIYLVRVDGNDGKTLHLKLRKD